MLSEKINKTKHMNIRTNEADYLAIQDAARFHGKTLSGFVLDTVLSQIEDMEDIAAAEAYLKRKASGKVKTISLDEMIRRYG